MEGGFTGGENKKERYELCNDRQRRFTARTSLVIRYRLAKRLLLLHRHHALAGSNDLTVCSHGFYHHLSGRAPRDALTDCTTGAVVGLKKFLNY